MDPTAEPTARSRTATERTCAKRTTLQEREVHRYYRPWLDAHGSSLNVASHVDSIAIDDLNAQGYTPRSSHDKALIAFAQLAVLRLGVKRAMVSLIDSTQQYVLAEATGKSFMTRGTDPDDSEYHTPDDVWLGSTILSRPDAICEHCFITKCTGVNADGRKWTCSGLIVNDCRQDERFQGRTYVESDPGVRFYAGVPIISRGGYMIGSYAVADEQPRDGLSADELKFMQEMAQSVMDHLEWARDRVDRFKGERIVRGMAAFIEGASTLSGRQNEKARQPSQSGSAENGSPAPSPGPGTRPMLTSRRSSQDTRATKSDKMSRMFDRATQILREATLADGAVLFGAAAGLPGKSQNMKAAETAAYTAQASISSKLNVPKQYSPDSESGGHSTVSGSDSDTNPSTRPCKILALNLADEQAQDDIEQKSALSFGTLEKYWKLFPRGRTFYFTDKGSGLSSGDESMSDIESRASQRKGRLDHKELLRKIPGAKSVTFLPLYDYIEEKLVAGCFLWTSVTGRMMNLDEGMSHLHAFGSSIMSEVARINAQKNEAAKTTFIASMSHELRSPLHGILGATEFLKDTAADSYQVGLITSIVTCGKTLLDTLNHVLDYSKINKLGRAQMRRNARQNRLVNLASDSSLESINMTAEVDLDVLVEEVVEAVTAGHAFKKNDLLSSPVGATVIMARVQEPGQQSRGKVSILLDITPRASWKVKTQPGAVRRIIMNLLGNALKYTSSGFVAVSMSAHDIPNSSKLNTIVQIVDTGKGMSEEFQNHRLFLPFSQEDSFQPGTGLGLSIVKQIADSLSANIDVRSELNVGTEIDVDMALTPATRSSVNHEPEHDVEPVANMTKGSRLTLVNIEGTTGGTDSSGDAVTRFEDTLSNTCEEWFGMHVSRANTASASEADFLLYTQPPPVDYLLAHHQHEPAPDRIVPIIITCHNAEEAARLAQWQGRTLVELGRVVEVLPQPCGPRKLAKVLERCARAKEQAAAANGAQPHTSDTQATSHPLSTEDEGTPRASATASMDIKSPEPERPTTAIRNDSGAILGKSTPDSDVTPAISLTPASTTSPPPLDPNTPPLCTSIAQRITPTPPEPERSPIHVLLVDDNAINLQLLVMFMKKHTYSFTTASNGQEALDKYKESCLPGPHTQPSAENPEGLPLRRFDYVLMDISMPVMNGMDSTRLIREFERENSLSRATVIALTGLASAQAQREAEVCGIDIFLPKPVRFAELKKLLIVK